MAATSTRQDRLYRELRTAIAHTSAQRLTDWGRESAKRLPKLAARRIKNLGRLLANLVKFTSKELQAGTRAIREGRFGAHIEKRSADAIDGTIGAGKSVTQTIMVVGKALFGDPRKNAPNVFALALGFYTGSGGLDGNGGIPDTDITYLGIGAHRSILTHSIIAGTLVEGAILALADLADVVCEKIPASDRDPFWDKLVETKNNIALQLVKGTSAGVAYHLAVDATLQPGTYHGLPWSMPIEGHQALLGLNAIGEGVDVGHKGNTTGQKVVGGVKTAGGAVAKGAVAGVGAVWGLGKGFIAGLKSSEK